MNKAFTKSKELLLDEKYSIIPDSDNGVVLVFKEQRTKEIMIKQQGKRVGTGSFEPFEYVDRWYFPRISQALKHYTSNIFSQDLNNLADNVEKVYELIEKINQEFKQF